MVNRKIWFRKIRAKCYKLLGYCVTFASGVILCSIGSYFSNIDNETCIGFIALMMGA